MNTPEFVPSRMEVLPTRAAPGFLTTDDVFVLQRRDVGSHLQAGAPFGLIEVQPRAGGWLARVDHAGGRDEIHVPGLDQAVAAAAELATRLAGARLRVAPFIAAYTFGSDAVDRPNDRIVSPLKYEPGSDTVRIVGTNHCVAAFTGGTFAGARIFTEDRGGATAWPFIDRALHTGFHECNRIRGDPHCKRHLAWMAGALWLHESPSPLTCGVLSLDMQLPRR
jgi:hypothetical protein